MTDLKSKIEELAKEYVVSIYGLPEGMDDFEDELQNHVMEDCAKNFDAGATSAIKLMLEEAERHVQVYSFGQREFKILIDHLKAYASTLKE
jgi:hypothetical protein